MAYSKQGSFGGQQQQGPESWDQYKQQMAQQNLALEKKLADIQAEQAGRPEMATWADLRERIPGGPGSVAPTYGGKGVPGGVGKGGEMGYGLLKEPYRLTDPTKDSRVGLGLLQAEATRTGPSQWRQLEEARQADMLARQGAGQLAGAQSALAMRGGMRGGAGERMAAQMGRQGLLGRQNIAQQTAVADEQRRMQAMGQLPGAELQEAGFQRGVEQYNIDKALSEQFQKRASDLMQYKEQMRAWASEKTAAATPSSGGGGGLCFITTAVCEKLGLPDDNPILNEFRKFRDVHMGGKEAVAEYYELAPKIVARIEELKADDVYYDILSKWLIPALKEIHHGNYDNAQAIYTEMVTRLKESYLEGEDK